MSHPYPIVGTMAAVFELSPDGTGALPWRGSRVGSGSRSTRRPPTGAHPRRSPGRDRLWFLAALLVLVAAVLLASLLSAVAGGTGSTGASSELVVIGPGDTLWSVAEEHLPGHDRHLAVSLLEDLNGPSAGLRVGDVVVIPEP